MKKINIIDLVEFEDMEETFKEDYPEKYEEVAAFYKENKQDYFLRERYPDEFSEKEIEKSLSLQLVKSNGKVFNFILNASKELYEKLQVAMNKGLEIVYQSNSPNLAFEFGDEGIFISSEDNKFLIYIGNEIITLNEEIDSELIKDIQIDNTDSWTFQVKEI